MKPAALLLDSNLLVLLVVGLASSELIGRHKRLKAYSASDFQLLSTYLSMASAVMLTPNTLTETSNLVRNIEKPAKTRIGLVLNSFVLNAGETYVAGAAAVARPEFFRLGLTDSALLAPEFSELTLLTADLQLYLAALRAGRSAINFNHLRTFN